MAIAVHSEKLRELVDENAEVEQVATGFTFTEGPIWHPDGYLHQAMSHIRPPQNHGDSLG